MKYIYITLLSLLLLSCSADHEIETHKPINWEEELFGVGLYGTHPDSLDQVWYSFPMNKNALEPIEGQWRFNYQWSFKIKGDTLKVKNLFFHDYLDTVNWKKRRDVMEDSSSFVLSWLDSSYFKLNKIQGHKLVPEELFIRLSSSKLDPQFEHLEIRTNFASAPTDIKLFVFPDTAFHIMHCYFCDTLPDNSTTELKENEIEFIHSYINTLIKMRNSGRRSNAVCTLGYGYDMKLVYDSLVYEYDNLAIFSIVPDILHQYLSNTVDINRYSPLKVDEFDYRFFNVRERTQKYREYERGNDLVDTVTVQEIPSTEELIPPKPETNTTETPPIVLDVTDSTFDTTINIKQLTISQSTSICV